MTVAIYARQSVEKKDSVSIDTQIEECKTRASKNDNVQVYFDEGSGALRGRWTEDDAEPPC